MLYYNCQEGKGLVNYKARCFPSKKVKKPLDNGLPPWYNKDKIKENK